MPELIAEVEKKIINEAVDAIAAVFITDTKGRFFYVNKTFCELTQYTSDELIGQSASIFKSGFHTDEFYQNFWETIESGKEWRGVFCNKTKFGNLIWLDTIVKPVFDGNKIEKFLGIRLNVTENIQNKYALKAQEEQLETASKFATIGEISGFIAHEINNPLTIMSLTINSLNSALNAELPDMIKVKKLNNKMNDVTNRIAKIVLALRNFSRSGTSQMEPHKFKEIIEDVILITEDIAKSDAIDLIIESDVDDGLILKCHKTQLSQVVINLIKNSCDAVRLLDKREVKLKISLNGEMLEMRVIDSGTRIPDDVATRLFTPYYTTKTEGKGTGIGLTISSKIIEAHGGKLFLDRESEQTCFFMTIPLKQ
jgi:PAS domain S-box-containing protein